MITITINDQKIEVEEGTSLLKAALDHNIYIPHICHHPDLPEISTCKLCLVDIEGEEKPLCSCKVKVKDGMVVHTESEEVTRLRNLAMELILAAHPEDCSTCPKYGQCELQNLIQYMNVSATRMHRRVKGFKEIKNNPLYIHDMNRCILCGRCVRACHDMRHVGILDYKKKGVESYVGTLHEKLLKDEDCRFCGACAEVCPTGTIRDIASYSASDKWDQLIPCHSACPAHTDVPRYVRYVSEGKYDEAAAVVREKAPFPHVLGYVCNHVCEGECRRQAVSDPISIRNIKRYAAEHDTGRYWHHKGKQLPDTNKKVAIVGAGVAGLTAAYYLRKQGHDVTVFEQQEKAGGMMQYGIPSYRLPRKNVDEEINYILETGIHLKTNHRIDDVNALKKDYDAILLAVGNQQGRILKMEGSDASGVLTNLSFLRQVAKGQETGMGEHVIVLGGGNVAFDCARSAKRMGAKDVHVAALEARDKMTADEEEILEAIEEGITIHPGVTFEHITTKDGHVSGVGISKIASFTFDENRQAVIEKVPDSYELIAGDTVIFAVGQSCDLGEKKALERGKANSIVTNEENGMTSIEGIFACGDAVYGTKSVILAIAKGREVASSMDKYLGGDGDISEVLAPVEHINNALGKREGFGYEERIQPTIVAPDNRIDNFNLVNLGIDDDKIKKEASRCLQCDLRCHITHSKIWSEYRKEQA